MHLTDISIRALLPPEKGAKIYTDDILPGFGVRITAAGVKSFVLTHGPRRERETIGRVGIVSLKDARQKAKDLLAEYTLGKGKATSAAWKTALKEYLSEIEANRKPRTHADYKRLLEKHFRYGETKLADLTPADLQKSLDRLKDTPAERRHAFVVLRAFIKWAYSRSYLDKNPMERMKAPPNHNSRERVLTDDELKRVYLAAGKMKTFGKIVRLLILTGQRVGEISQLTGDMVGDGTITLPSWLTKNSKEHKFPIGKLSASMLTSSGKTPNSTEYFFPARGKTDQPFNGFSKSKAKLDELSGVTDWTLHDLRRTFASGMASLGVSLPVVEKLLNHISGSFAGVVGIYQRYDFAPEMRIAVDKWEHHIRMLVYTRPIAVQQSEIREVETHTSVPRKRTQVGS